MNYFLKSYQMFVCVRIFGILHWDILVSAYSYSDNYQIDNCFQGLICGVD